MAGSAVFSASTPVPVRMPSVLTTASFAVKPVMSAVEMRQSSKPSGRNSGERKRPMAASRLSALFVTKFSRASKDSKNQITSVATKITVKARCKKSLALSHSSITTLLPEGSR